MKFIKKNYKFKPGRAIELNKSKIGTIISSGPLIHNCIEAIKILSKKIKVGLININSFKPFNINVLKNLIKKKYILVVEDHVSHGGISSLVYETIANLSQ